MSLKTRVLYAEEVLNELQIALRNRDEKIRPEEVYLQLDNCVNELAKKGFLENWKFGWGGIDEQFLTTWEWLTLTDPANGMSSYIQIPANYAALRRNEGIHQVYFKNDFTVAKKKYFDTVIIKSSRDVAGYRNNMAGNLEGRLSCYPSGGNLVFDRGDINTTYGDIGLKLVIRDSSAISDSAPYPIPANHEKEVITTVVDWFRNRKAQPQDLIRDNVDKP